MRKVWMVSFATLFASATALAEEPSVEELRRELKSLRTEVQSLRLAISEAAELDRQRAAMLTRALEGQNPAANDAPAGRAERRPAPGASAASGVAAGAAAAGAVGGAAGSTGAIIGKLQVPSGEPVAYVYVENIQDKGVRGQRVTIEQVRKQFAPRWAVIQRGTTIEFPNLDNVHHNVFSRTPGNTFDLGLYSSAEAGKAHTFNTPGPVDIYCNIHPRMAASVLVVPNKHFAKVREDGTFEIPAIPAGKRKLVAWAPGSETQAVWLDVKPGAVGSPGTELEFAL